MEGLFELVFVYFRTEEDEFGDGFFRVEPFVVSEFVARTDFLEEELLLVAFEAKINDTFGTVDFWREGADEFGEGDGVDGKFFGEGCGGEVVVEVWSGFEYGG